MIIGSATAPKSVDVIGIGYVGAGVASLSVAGGARLSYSVREVCGSRTNQGIHYPKKQLYQREIFPVS